MTMYPPLSFMHRRCLIVWLQLAIKNKMEEAAAAAKRQEASVRAFHVLSSKRLLLFPRQYFLPSVFFTKFYFLRAPVLSPPLKYADFVACARIVNRQTRTPKQGGDK